MSLTLSLAGISATIVEFLDSEYPRTEVKADGSVLEYSHVGVPARFGTQYQPKYLWAVNALVDYATWDTIMAIYVESEKRRRALLTFEITLTDKTSEIIEVAPRTRAIASGTSEVSLFGGSYTKYFAQFKCCFIDAPRRSKSGTRSACQFQLQETILISA